MLASEQDDTGPIPASERDNTEQGGNQCRAA
jgi:hypothetical protein